MKKKNRSSSMDLFKPRGPNKQENTNASNQKTKGVFISRSSQAALLKKRAINFEEEKKQDNAIACYKEAIPLFDIKTEINSKLFCLMRLSFLYQAKNYATQEINNLYQVAKAYLEYQKNQEIESCFDENSLMLERIALILSKNDESLHTKSEVNASCDKAFSNANAERKEETTAPSVQTIILPPESKNTEERPKKSRSSSFWNLSSLKSLGHPRSPSPQPKPSGSPRHTRSPTTQPQAHLQLQPQTQVPVSPRSRHGRSLTPQPKPSSQNTSETGNIESLHQGHN